MKNRNHERFALDPITGWWMRNVGLTEALYYSHAAQREERDGFPYTAATDWRHAAELLVSGSLAAEYCWRQWERIMHLPRQLAGPVGSSRDVIIPWNPDDKDLSIEDGL